MSATNIAGATSGTNLSRPASQASMGPGSSGSGSRIEVSTVQVNQDDQAGSLTVYGGGQYSIRTTISREGTNYQIADQTGQVRNLNVPAPQMPPGQPGKYEKRIILDNGVETVEEYRNDRLVSRTVNGVPQAIS